MEGLIALGVIIAVLWLIIAIIMTIIEKITMSFPGLFPFFVNNYLLFLGLGCLSAALYFYLFYKPHPAEKYIESYKKGKLPRNVAAEKVADTLYNSKRDKIPPTYQSKYWTTRISALTKRIRAENEFMEEVIKYIKTKSRLD